MKTFLRTGAAIGLAFFVACSLGLPRSARAVSVLNQGGESLLAGDAGQSSTMQTTTVPFDPMGGSKLLVTLSAETAGFPGGSMPPGASVASVLFGVQPLSPVTRTVDPSTTQITEIWEIDLPFDQPENISVTWDAGNGSGVGGVAIGFVSLNNVALGVGPSAVGNNPSDVDVTFSVPDADSFVIATAVTNASSQLDADAPLIGVIESANAGSALGATAYLNDVGSGPFSANFSNSSTSRPAASAAAFAPGPFAETFPRVDGDTDGDGDVDVDDFNNIRDSLGYTGLPAGLGPDVAGADGVVDFLDLRFFQANFPTVASGGLTQPISAPEPASVSLAGLGLIALASRRRVQRV